MDIYTWSETILRGLPMARSVQSFLTVYLNAFLYSQYSS
jgi:hypothetical protein